MKDFKRGQKVKINDPGLLALEQFKPEGVRSNTWGWMHELQPNGDVVILFPIGDDDPSEHSQIASYPPNQIEEYEWAWKELQYPKELKY